MTANLDHIRIENDVVGIFNVYDTNTNQLHVTSHDYYLFQLLIQKTEILCVML